MNSDRRSPWVVLGIPFPASKAAAKRAFARRSRALRRDPEIPWAQEDLAWAEAEITLATENPDATINYYRVPADPGAYERARSGDLFVPDPVPLPRRTELASPDVLDDECAEFALAELRNWLAQLVPNPDFEPYA